ncbi:hypothetical protein [Parageobacillus thermoglucosidasius]|nr:hypothetical protein [Parageobacillus thermoglucosidasius]MED4946459.1 hypothetical protein [Parageobacillus thermoglucosidasius]MED4984020.1 hypothetical protein [Parageobacillus thermoglucosidasius]
MKTVKKKLLITLLGVALGIGTLLPFTGDTNVEHSQVTIHKNDPGGGVG